MGKDIILIAGLSFLFIVLTFLIFYLIYFVRKIRSSQADKFNLIQFPKETDDKINDLIGGIQEFAANLDQAINVKQKKDIHEISERLKTFATVANEKNEELKAYKAGFHVNNLKGVLVSIIDIVDFIKVNEDKIASNESSKGYLQATIDKLEIILSNYNVEKFTPQSGIKIVDATDTEPSTKTENTDDNNKVNTIHSVIRPGFKVEIKKGESVILKKALAVVYAKKG